MTFNIQNTSATPVEVAFIFYNYTTKLLLKKQLDFFTKANLSFSYSLTVVDDASLDKSREFIESYAGITYVLLNSFHGVGRAFNRGIEIIPESRFLCLLQTDVNLNSEALNSLVQYCRSHHEVKVCAPTISFPWGHPQKFIFNPNILTMYSGSIDKWLSKAIGKKLLQAKSPIRVAGIIGPFLFCSHELLVGNRLYDEKFQQYFCDLELAHRLMKQNIVCEVLPYCSLVRLGGQTSFIRDQNMYFSMKYEYVKIFYGQQHASLSFKRDLLRAKFKTVTYKLFNWIVPSSKLSFQIERYANLVAALKNILKIRTNIVH